FAETLVAEESREAFARRIAENGTSRDTITTLVRTRPGHLRSVTWEVARTSDSAELAIFLTGHDTTEERALADRRRQPSHLAAVGTLAAGLAHEIRNPLNGAQLHVSFLARTLSKSGGNAETLEAVAVVGDEIKRLAMLVTEFLDFARPKPLARKPTTLGALTE